MKLLSAVASATLLAVLTPSVHAQTLIPSGPTSPTLTVSGRGEVSAAPDRAVVRLGAIAQADQASAAQSQVNQIMQQSINAIKALGIPPEQIGTTGLSLSPVYAGEVRPASPQQQPSEPRIAGYRASNVIRVELTDLKRLGDVIDAGIASGANRLEGVSFDLKNDREQRKEALKEAVKEARDKAEAIAGAMGVGLQAVSEITEGGVNIISPQEQYGGVARMAAMEAPTPVQPGQVRVEAQVTVRYAISQGAGPGR